MTGPIPTGGGPDVKPLYFAQNPTFGAALTPQVQLLMSVLQEKQARKERADKLVLDRMAGNTLRDVLVAADTDLIPAPGNAAFTASGMPGVQPFAPVTVEGPLAKELKGRPGEAVLAAAPYLTGIISGRETRRSNRERQFLENLAERAKALKEQGKPSFIHFVTADNTMASVDQNTGTGEIVTYSSGPKKGQPIPVARAATQGPQVGTTPYLDVRPKSPTYGQIVPLPDGGVVDPNSFVDLKDARTSAAVEAADFYPLLITAYKQVRNVRPVSEEDRNTLTTFIGTMSRAKADANAFGLFVANKTLTPEARRWMNGMLDLAQAFIYKRSGKAVTAGEFVRFIASGIPLPWEDDPTQEEKWTRLDSQIDGVGAQARGALLLRGQKDVPPFADVRDPLRTERARRAEIRRLAAPIRAAHPEWSDEKVATEAQKQYNSTRPAGAP